ncbi:MAG TPA: dihydrodipicolinate synthase family protein [Candidatus Baltobacteraceae bacterium]|nr:dihydrodipicolinate synthase family protein [Candidatus Baltobacteraceae bacterium]
MSSLRGIWSAVPTPVDSRFAPDHERAIAFYRELLAGGCDGINLLGTTGQAMSFDVGTRRALMKAVAQSDLPNERVMCGTGAASLADTIALTRMACDCDFAAALVMPPFFYRDASDDGILRFFERLFDATPGTVLLYNFPRMSGITFHLELLERLLAEFPGRIVGIKDSSNDRDYQRTVIARHPELAVFPGSEGYLLEALRDGAAGCISGSVALWPQLAQAVCRERGAEDGSDLSAKRASVEGAPLIPAMHARIAQARGDDEWRRVVPPLTAAN